MKAVAMTKNGASPVEPDQEKSFEENLKDASEIATDVDNVNFIAVQK